MSIKFKYFLSMFTGAVAGACAKSLIAPLDRQKIIFQVTNRGFSLATAFRAMKLTYEQHGVRLSLIWAHLICYKMHSIFVSECIFQTYLPDYWFQGAVPW